MTTGGYLHTHTPLLLPPPSPHSCPLPCPPFLVPHPSTAMLIAPAKAPQRSNAWGGAGFDSSYMTDRLRVLSDMPHMLLACCCSGGTLHCDPPTDSQLNAMIEIIAQPAVTLQNQLAEVPPALPRTLKYGAGYPLANPLSPVRFTDCYPATPSCPLAIANPTLKLHIPCTSD